MPAAQRLSGLKESVIREMYRLALKHNALNLAQGFPDFDPPQAVVEAGVKALQNGHNQYTITWGNSHLRTAIAAKYADWYGMNINPDTDITVTCGVTEAIIAALMSVINPGDRVLILDPSHENYLAGVLFAGGEPVWVSMNPPHFELNEDELRIAFLKKPKAIIFNTPHNPVGYVFNKEILQLIADLCIEHNTIAITDEIYEHIIYDERVHIPIATLPGMANRTITTSGLTKTYATTGWRVAWAIAPPSLSKPLRTVHDYLTICAPAPLQEAAITALNLPKSYYTNLSNTYHLRRDKIISILTEAGFSVIPPQGAYYVLADYSAIQPDMDDVTFTRWLITNKKVAVVPGGSFYRHNPELGNRLIRFSFCKKLQTLERARQLLTN